MSPRKFLDGNHKQQKKIRAIINGPRPTPLTIKQESRSHTIHKHQRQSMIRKPVIIYIRSPEVIHTKPHEFMDLVQKLTGYSGSKNQEQKQKKTLEDEDDLNDHELYDDSGVTNERNDAMKSKSPMFSMPLNPYVGDIPLFTPNTSDYFFSPQRFLRLSDMLSSSPNKNTSSSPGSLVDLKKLLPDY